MNLTFEVRKYQEGNVNIEGAVGKSFASLTTFNTSIIHHLRNLKNE